MRRNKIHCYEPFLKWKVGIFKYRSNQAREVMLALITTETTVLALYAMVLTTMWTNNIISPTSFCKCLFADILVIEMINH